MPYFISAERERERERQIHVRICYDLWVFATVANTHFSFYGYLLPQQILIEISSGYLLPIMGICYRSKYPLNFKVGICYRSKYSQNLTRGICCHNYGYSISQHIIKLISGYKYVLPTISNTHFIFKFYFCFHYIVIFLCRKYWLRFTTKYSPEVLLFSIKVLPNCFHTGLIFIYLFTFFLGGGGVFRCKKFPSPFEQNT